MQLLQTIEKASKTKTAEDEAWDILNDDKEEDNPKPSALKTAQTAATKKVMRAVTRPTRRRAKTDSSEIHLGFRPAAGPLARRI